MRYKIIWKHQGNIKWEDWWVQKYGRKRSRIPNFEEHIGFANYDLQRYGAVISKSENDLYVTFEPENFLDVFSILVYHGFYFEEDFKKMFT